MAIQDASLPEATPPSRVGIICNRDHDVFARVADRLRSTGVRVQFFVPGRPVTADDLSGLSLLMNKKVDPHSFRALRDAEVDGTPTWNGYRTLFLGARLVGYRALERAGCRVPPVSLDPPDGDYVAKTRFDWHFHPDPELNGEGDLYQELLDVEPIDYKYYAVDTGEEVLVRVLRATSKLYGDKEYLDLVDPDPEVAACVRRLLRSVGAQALGVDFVRSEGEYWAVDVNPAMSFREADMVGELATSVLALLPGPHPSVPSDK